MINDGWLSDAELLDELAGTRERERAARNHKLIMITHWAERKPPESINPDQLNLAGGDRPIHPGGAGTPSLARFAVFDLAATLRISRRAAELLIADALDIRYRLPRLWARLCANEIEGWQAQKIAAETRHLTQQQADQVDEAIAATLDRKPWGTIRRLLAAKIIEVNAEQVAQLAHQRAAELGVTLSDTDSCGHRTMTIKAEAATLIWFNATLQHLTGVVERSGDHRPNNLRALAALDLMGNPCRAVLALADDCCPTLFDDDPDFGAPDYCDRDGLADAAAETDASDVAAAEVDDSSNTTADEGTGGPESPITAEDRRRSPLFDRDHDLRLARTLVRGIGQLDPAKLRPSATLYVHIAVETLQSGVGVTRVEDLGPIISTLVGGWLQRCDLTVQPVINLNVDATPVDGYEIPRKMRERMFLKQPGSIFPYSSSTSRRLDLDHSAPYRDGRPAQTREDNLGPLSRPEHNLITHGQWQRRQPRPGTYLFRAPHGTVLLVDRSGTTDLGQDQFAQGIWHAAAPTEHQF